MKGVVFYLKLSFREGLPKPKFKAPKSNKKFTQRRRKLQLLTYNTPSSKGYCLCFFTYSLLTTKKIFAIFFFKKATLYAQFSLMLLNLLLNLLLYNIPISVDGPVNCCIYTQVRINVSQNTMYLFRSYNQIFIESCLFQGNFFLS